MSASHEYFAGPGDTIDQERLERWVAQEMKFLRDRRNCGICAKAVLHMDERTPHIHAHMVPITDDGRLSATHFLDGRKKMKELHTRHAEYMKELGLERGREGSRATHQRVKQFYASVTKEPELRIEPDRIPDPNRLKVLTAEGARAYKLEVLKHVLEQIQEPVRILQDQARLTKDEHAHRVEAEKRAAEAERQAAERVVEASREAEERVAAVRCEEAQRFENLRRSAVSLYEENKELFREKDELRVQCNELNEALMKMTHEKQEFQMLARQYHDRLTDIPMPEIMERLGYEGERQGEAHVYRGDRNQVAMLIEKQRAYDGQRELICKNSLELVVHMRRNNEGVEVSPTTTPSNGCATSSASRGPGARRPSTASTPCWTSSSASASERSFMSARTIRGAGRRVEPKTMTAAHVTTIAGVTAASASTAKGRGGANFGRAKFVARQKTGFNCSGRRSLGELYKKGRAWRRWLPALFVQK